jgi:hypothetical protein
LLTSDGRGCFSQMLRLLYEKGVPFFHDVNFLLCPKRSLPW